MCLTLKGEVFTATRRLCLIAAMAAQLATSAVFAQTDGSSAPATSDSAPEALAADAALAAGPMLECSIVGLHILAPEVSGARVVCRVAGAASDDTSFTVSAIRPSLATSEPRPICGDTPLSGGAGTCIGSFVDRASSTLGPLSLSATLSPSGSVLGPMTVGPPSPPATPPMQFYPLPDR